jgi:hypothetical protein
MCEVSQVGLAEDDPATTSGLRSGHTDEGQHLTVTSLAVVVVTTVTAIIPN